MDIRNIRRHLVALVTRNNWLMVLSLIVLIAGLTEGAWGTLQLLGAVPSGHPRYPVTGSFYNPGPFGCWLGCIFPLALCVYLRPQTKWMKWMAAAYLLMCALLLPGGMSRTGWIAAVTGSMLSMAGMYWSKLRAVSRRWIAAGVVAVCISACAGGYAMYHLKKDSADGRLLMWKVAMLATTHTPLEGVGWDYIAGAYGDAQEEYFRDGMASGYEAMVAGTPVYVFNEYLQIAVAFGIPCGVALLLSFLLSYGLYMRSRQYGMAGVMVGIFVTCMASYPFQFMEFRWFIFLTVICALLLIRRRWLRVVSVAACTTAILLFLTHTPDTDINAEFRRAHALYQSGRYREAIDHFVSFLPKTSDPMPLNLLGKCYQSIGMPDSAEHYYVRSTHRVPNRLYPHYLLMKLYAEQLGDSTKMLREANYILTMEPKNHSKAIDEMRDDARELISK